MAWIDTAVHDISQVFRLPIAPTVVRPPPSSGGPAKGFEPTDPLLLKAPGRELEEPERDPLELRDLEALDDIPLPEEGPGLVSEAIAWYESFHYLGFQPIWGTYFRAGRMAKLAERWRRSDGAPPSEFRSYFRSLFRLLLRHELFHAQVDLFALQAELITRREVYWPYHHGVYVPFRHQPDPMWLEEALAEAAAMRTRTPHRHHYEAMARRGAPGYRDFGPWVKPPDFQHGLALLSEQVLDLVRFPSGHRPAVAFPEIGGVFGLKERQVPRHLVELHEVPPGLRALVIDEVSR